MISLILVGESLKKFKTRGCDFGKNQKQNYSKCMIDYKTIKWQLTNVCYQEKVMSGSGTWIDWQYLFDAAKLLAKCRYTLQYTYPYAYYMELCPRKQLVDVTLFCDLLYF